MPALAPEENDADPELPPEAEADAEPNWPASSLGTRGSARRRNRRCAGPMCEARYRVLVEQIPAVVFHGVSGSGDRRGVRQPADRGQRWGSRRANGWKIRCAGISRFIPRIRIAGAAKRREMFLSGKPLRSAYRVMARDGRVVWFHCEAQTGPPRRRAALVHSRRRVRYHGAEASRRERCSRSAISSPRFSIRSARWSWCSIRRAASSGSTAPAS